MASSVKKFVAEFVADVSGLVQGFNKAESESSKLSSAIATGVVKAQVVLEAARVAAQALGAALTSVTTDTANYGDELAKASQRTGVSVESLGRLRFAAGQAGANFTEVSSGLRVFAGNIDEASKGTKLQAETFERLGVTVKTSSGAIKPMNDLIGEVADKFKGLPDGVEKAAMAQDLFGRGGAALIPLLNSGSEGLAEMGAKAEELGIVMSTKTAKAGEAFNDRLDDLQQAFFGVSLSIGEHLLPPLTSLITAFSNAIIAVSAWVRNNPAIVQSFVKLGESIVSYAVKGVSLLISGLGRVYQTISIVAEAVGAKGLAANYREAEETARSMASSIDRLNDEFVSGIGTVKESNIELPRFDTQLKNVGATADKAAKDHQELQKAVAATAKEYKEFESKASLDFFKRSQEAMAEEVRSLEAGTKFRAQELITRLKFEKEFNDSVKSINKEAQSDLEASLKRTTDIRVDEIKKQLEKQKEAREAEKKAMEEAVNDVKRSAGEIFDAMFIKGESVFGSLTNALKGGALSLGRSIFEDVTGALLGPIKKAFDDFFAGLLEGAGIRSLISGLGDRLGSALSGIFGGGGGVASAAGGGAAGIPGVGGSVSGLAGGASGLAGGVIAGGISALGSIIGAFMGEGNARRTEENTRETRDWLELQTVAWNPLFHEMRHLMEFSILPQIVAVKDLVAEIRYDALPNLATTSASPTPTQPTGGGATFQLNVTVMNEGEAKSLIGLINQAVQFGGARLVATEIRA